MFSGLWWQKLIKTLQGGYIDFLTGEYADAMAMGRYSNKEIKELIQPDFYKYLSAYKNLEIFGRISGKDLSKMEIYKFLDFVGLTGREKDKVSGFSHGMKQRLGIAQTLMHDPDIIILDEPTTGLDPQGIIEVRNLILRLRDEQNKTVLLSSHQLSEIEIIANRMVIINKGETIVEGSVQE
jgi:ABC-2 type transport system ATP-binding protein